MYLFHIINLLFLGIILQTLMLLYIDAIIPVYP